MSSYCTYQFRLSELMINPDGSIAVEHVMDLPHSAEISQQVLGIVMDREADFIEMLPDVLQEHLDYVNISFDKDFKRRLCCNVQFAFNSEGFRLNSHRIRQIYDVMDDELSNGFGKEICGKEINGASPDYRMEIMEVVR